MKRINIQPMAETILIREKNEEGVIHFSFIFE
jgi:hypothetical protein